MNNKRKLAAEMGRDPAFSDGYDSPYKTSQRFNLANFTNFRSVSKGFSNKHIQFYNEKKNQIGSRYSSQVGNRADMFKTTRNNSNSLPSGFP
jgi:hypothetical protein